MVSFLWTRTLNKKLNNRYEGGNVMKIKNASETANLKVAEAIVKLTTLAPGEELTTDENTVEIEIATA